MECSTVLQFFDFLRGNRMYRQPVPMPAGYTIATEEWVSGVLMGFEFPGVVQQPVQHSDNLFMAITTWMGGNGGGQSRMALLEKKTNNYKGKLFDNENLNRIDSGGLRKTKLMHRAVSRHFCHLFTDKMLTVEI